VKGTIHNDHDSPIIPLRTSNCLFFADGSAGNNIKDVYQSPIPGDPSLNYQPKDLFVNKEDLETNSKATVIEISGPRKAGVLGQLYLPVEFVKKRTSMKKQKKLCCVTQPDVHD
jgi:hypothetical protein